MTSAETLIEIARRYGTPTYAFDLARMRVQADALRRHLPDAVEVLYSLKANASLGICEALGAYGLGADVASAGELATAVAAGFDADRIFVAGPFKQTETVAQLRELPQAIVSVDSFSELEMLARELPEHAMVLRLRPDFGSSAVVAAGSDSRFGFTQDDLPRCREFLDSHKVNVIGFHVFAGSQVLNTGDVIDHLRGGLDLSLRVAEQLGVVPRLLNLGGGFGTPYGPGDHELDLATVGHELSGMVDRVSPTKIVLELGRYLVAQAGWYLTAVLGAQTHRGRRAVVVDGGTHQRADLCGLCLRSKAHPPVSLSTSIDEQSSSLEPTDVLGCLSLPADVLAESSALPSLSTGDVLAFADAGAYGVWSSPAMFHGSPLPAEVAFDGRTIQLMRKRRPAESILEGQRRLAVDIQQPVSARGDPEARRLPDDSRTTSG
jgi:diaminopimelate decarboxylase